jgi:hypothetical protein
VKASRPTSWPLLTQAIPELADHLRSVDARSEARSDELKAAIGDIAKQLPLQHQHNVQGAELLQWLAQSLACYSSALGVGAGAGQALGAPGVVVGAVAGSCYAPARPSLAPSLAPSPPDSSANNSSAAAATSAAAAGASVLPDVSLHEDSRGALARVDSWPEWPAFRQRP